MIRHRPRVAPQHPRPPHDPASLTDPTAAPQESPPSTPDTQPAAARPADPPRRRPAAPASARPRRPLRLGNPRRTPRPTPTPTASTDPTPTASADTYADRLGRHLRRPLRRPDASLRPKRRSKDGDSRLLRAPRRLPGSIDRPAARYLRHDPAERGSTPVWRSTRSTAPERVTIVPLPLTAAKLRAVVRNSWLDDCRFGVLCGAALLARSPFESAQALFNSWPLREASSTQRGSRSGGDRDPDRRRAAPTSSHSTTRAESSARRTDCSGAFFGFGSSGGFHNGGLLALMAVLLGFTFLQSTRRVTPPEQRVHGPLLVLSLERPG